MKRDGVMVEIKTTDVADKAVLEIDEAVRERMAALDSGKVRPSASGLIRCATGMVRDASGLIRDASGLIRDASGLIRDDETAEHYKRLAERVRDLSAEAARFSRCVRTFVDLAATEDVTSLTRDASGLIRDASGLIHNASGLIRDVLELVKGTTAEENLRELVKKADVIKERADNLENGRPVLAVVALIFMPHVYEELRLYPKAPLIVQFGLFVQHGVFWHVLIELILKGVL